MPALAGDADRRVVQVHVFFPQLGAFTGTDEAIALQLVEPASVSGRLIDARFGVPVPNGRVVVQPRYMSGFSRVAEVEADGRFHLAGLPPGQYQYHAVTPSHVDRPEGNHHDRGADLSVPGQHLVLNEFHLLPLAQVSGQVVDAQGEPVAGAWLAMPTGRRGAIHQEATTAWSDEQGRFTLGTGRFDQPLTLEAFSPTHGFARVQLERVTANERREVQPRLGGIVRLTGQVVDDQGQLIADAHCFVRHPQQFGVHSDTEGRFDLGLAPLPPDEQPLQLGVRPRRPPVGGVGYNPRTSRFVVQQADDVRERRYYVPRQLDLAAEHGQHVTAEVTLEQTQLLTIEGRVVDAQGEPAPGTNLYLFAGNALPEVWAREHARPFENMARSTITIPDQSPPLVTLTNEDDGTFVFHVLRLDGEVVADPQGVDEADARRPTVGFSLGVLPPGVADADAMLIEDIQFTPDQHDQQLTVQIDERGEAEAAE